MMNFACFEGSFKRLIFMNGALVSFMIRLNGNPATSQPAPKSGPTGGVLIRWVDKHLQTAGPGDTRRGRRGQGGLGWGSSFAVPQPRGL